MQGSVERRGEAGEPSCDCVAAEGGHRLGDEFVDDDTVARRRATEDALSQLDGGRTSELRVHVQQETIVFHAAGHAHLTNACKVQFAKKCGDVATLVMRVAFEVVDIENEAAT